jgi:hypothetical protein
MSASLAVNTKASQSSAVTAWRRFCGYAGADPLCRGVSSEKLEDIVVAYLAFEIGVRGLSPASMKKVYLSAIASHFVGCKIRNGFSDAIKSDLVKYVLRGYLKIYSLMHPAGEAKKLAFTIELIKYLRVVLTADQLKKHGGLFARGLDLALKFGIYFLLRKSEFLPGYSRIKSEPIRCGMKFSVVRFYDFEGSVVSWRKVIPGCAKSVEILVPRSKTDQYGYGRVVRHVRVSGPNCIVKELERWVAHCRDKLNAVPSDGLFCVGGAPILVEGDVAAAMKRIVVHLGWDASKISAHSLRYGGATMLAAAGLPQYVIEYFGGWAEGSKSAKFYMQVSGRSVANVSAVMSEGFGRSLEKSRIRHATR